MNHHEDVAPTLNVNVEIFLLLVTNAIIITMPNWIKLPSQVEADHHKARFFQKAGFPSVIGCIDGTHVRIQAPVVNEHEYVNRKNQHSINVQVLQYLFCSDATLTSSHQHTKHINIKCQ